ncbi:MAG: restriction endonuclease [Verrucomicrobia bacterium]|nr:restriction endonuclease [Verrucomicrobiota bacterium]
MTEISRIQRLVAALPALSNHQLEMIDGVVGVFLSPKSYRRSPKSDLISKQALDYFGDVLRLHHCFSREPFSKDKFEYALERVLLDSGVDCSLAPRGTKGHDILIKGKPCSLKTEAAKSIKPMVLHISKYMELGKGEWNDNPKNLEGLLGQFLANLKGVSRIFVLRTLEMGDPEYSYEMVEIPVSLLAMAEAGRLEMTLTSKQSPKPGNCFVEENGSTVFSLYFDGGTERKLQIKNLDKNRCMVHAVWRFSPPLKRP